jgi:hypothetical protein
MASFVHKVSRISDEMALAVIEKGDLRFTFVKYHWGEVRWWSG